VRDRATGDVKRVTDDRAEELVSRGTHGYVDRETWKKQGRN
jgi:hypothetical protein